MKKNHTVIFCIIIFLFILSFNLFIIPNNMDEVWNYGFSYAIRLGEVPYRDFNMVLPPLYSFIMTIPLLIWNNYLSFIIFHSLIMSGVFYLLFRMYKEYVFLLLLVSVIFFSNIYPTYNSFIISLCILIIFLEKSNYKYKEFLIGFFIACGILTKHTVGVFYIIPTLIFFKRENINIKNRIIGFVVPIIIFFIYLLCTNSIIQAFDMCVLGLFDFSSNTKGITISFYIFIIMFILSCIIILKNKRNITNYYIIFSYLLFVPIFDVLHLFYVIFLFVLLIGNNYTKKFFNYKLLLITIMILCFVMRKDCVISFAYPNNLAHFEYRYYNEDAIRHYNAIYDYIIDDDYIFYDDEAYFFKIITSRKIDSLDLVNYGNHGLNGSDKILKLLKENKDKKILIDSKYYLKTSQLDLVGCKYIFERYNKIDSVENYDVYEYRQNK